MSEKIKVDSVLDALEVLGPLSLAESWDPVGLHLGSRQSEVQAGLLCIDLTESVVAEAKQLGCGLVVAYHPPIFHPLQRLSDDGPWTQRRILAAARARLAVYSPHTALDAATGGLCDWMVSLLGHGESCPITPRQPKRDEYKVVVFVPEQSEATVRDAMTDAGAGGIGNYRGCSFSAHGTGGFTPVGDANPAIGRVGQREEVAERRLEMLVPGRSLVAVLSAVRSAHPYEEPAFDVFRLEPEPAHAAQAQGPGRLHRLTDPLAPAEITQKLREALGVPLRVGGAGRDAVRTVAVCPGAGGKLFESVDADAYVTGEMQHHQVLDLVQRGKLVVLAGHTHTERPYLPVYRDRIAGTAAGALDWHISLNDRCPWEQVG